jgi:hypothetical protein
MSSLETIKWRVAYNLKRFPFEISSFLFDRDNATYAEEFVGARGCDARKKGVMRISSFEVEKFL